MNNPYVAPDKIQNTISGSQLMQSKQNQNHLLKQSETSVTKEVIHLLEETVTVREGLKSSVGASN